MTPTFPEAWQVEGNVKFFQGQRYTFTGGAWRKDVDRPAAASIDLGPAPVWPKFDYVKVD